MPYDINTALQRLEQNLNDLTSARTQVESTIKASSELQKLVSEYVATVNNLCAKLQGWETILEGRESSLSQEIVSTISQLQTSCSQIVASFDTSVNKSIFDFKTTSESEISKFSEQNNILTERVKEMIALREQIEKSTVEIQSIKEIITQISKDLTSSQNKQDELLDDIKKNVDALPNTINTATSSIHGQLENLKRISEDGISSIINLENSTRSDLLQVASTCNGIKNETSQIISALQSFTQRIEEAISASKEENNKSININRWIIIAGIIILAVLHFIAK